MGNLKQMLKNEFDKDKGLATQLAKKIGHANPSALNKFVNTPDRELEDFNVLLTIIRELFPDREFEIMEKYIKTLNVNKKTARFCLEYTEIYKLNDLHKYLINKMKFCSNAESREWASVYELRLKRTTEKLIGTDALYELSKMNAKTPEMKAFVSFQKMFCLYDLNLLQQIIIGYDLLEKEVNDLPDEFIKSSYMERLSLIGANCFLYIGNVEKCREIANKALSKSYRPSILILHYLTLGNSYILESYEKANNYLNKGIDLSVNFDKNESLYLELRKSVNFNKIHWGNKPSYIRDIIFDDITANHQEAYYFIKQNQFEKAQEILNRVSIENLSIKSKAFYYYYKGLAFKNEKYLYISIKFFDKTGDAFFRRLPINALKETGEDPELINELVM